MKHLSLTLKIVAILAAAFCVYAWLDTKGLIKESMTHLDKLAGDSIVEKAKKVPGLLKDLKDTKVAKDKAEASAKNLEIKLGETNSDLEAERTKSVQINGELQKKISELRTSNMALEASKKKVFEQESLIDSLKKEIVAAKSMIGKTETVAASDDSKKKIASLEDQLAKKNDEIAKLQDKVKILDMTEIVEVIEEDPVSGKKIKRKTLKMPYVAKGDIATVLRTNLDKPNIIAINRGKNAKLQQGQKIMLKREGEEVARIEVSEIFDDYSICTVDMSFGIPETIEVDDLYELGSVMIKKPAVAPVPEQKPAAPKADSEENKAEA